MDIQNIKNTKLKKYILIISLMFIILLLLPCFISSITSTVYGFKSIKGYNWNNPGGCGRLYSYLCDNWTNDNYRNGKLNNNRELFQNLKDQEFFKKTCVGDSGGESGFHRAACSKDLGSFDYPDRMCTIVCAHAAMTSVEASSQARVNQVIIYDSSENKYFFKKVNKDGEWETDNPDEVTGFVNLKKFLAVGYAAQDDFETMEHYAEYLTQSEDWRPVDLDFWNSSADKHYAGYDSTLQYDSYHGKGNTIDKYDYKGIFVLYSCGASGGQGRMAFRVVRKKKNDNKVVSVCLKKIDASTNGKLNGAQIKVSSGDRIKRIEVDGVNYGKNASITIGTKWIDVYPEDGKDWFYLNIAESVAPTGYNAISGNLKIKVSFNNDGDVTNLEYQSESSPNWNDNYNLDAGNATITLKNTRVATEYKTNLYLRKTGVNNEPLIDAEFDVWIKNLSMSSYKTIVLGNTTLVDSGYGSDTSSEGFSWDYLINDNICNLHVWNIKTKCTDHNTNVNAILFQNLIYAGDNITVEVRETYAPSEAYKYDYYKINDGNPLVYNFPKSMLGGDTIIKSYSTRDVYGNGDSAHYNAAIGCAVIDIHNEPIYYADFKLNKTGFDSNAKLPAYVDITFTNVRIDYNFIPEFMNPRYSTTDRIEIRGGTPDAYKGGTYPYEDCSISSDGNSFTIYGIPLECVSNFEEYGIYIFNVAFRSQYLPITVTIKETSEPSGNGNYHYQKANDGKEMSFEVYASDKKSNNPKSFVTSFKQDKYGNEFSAWYDPDFRLD